MNAALPVPVAIDLPSLRAVLDPLHPQLAEFIAGYLQRWTPYKPGWVYEDGVIFQGALDLSEAGALPDLRRFVVAAVDARLGADGTIRDYRVDEYNIDNICAGRVLFALDELSPRQTLALAPLEAQLRDHPRTRSGNFWHKQIYPWQVWLDGLYMAQPFRSLLAQRRGDLSILDDIAAQFAVVREVLRDASSGLYFHGWDESRSERWADAQTGCSAHFWARAMGWFVVAMADILDIVGPEQRAGRFAPLQAQFADAANALLRVVAADGLWWQVLDQGARAGNYTETSASLMIANALLKGARIGVLPDAGRVSGLRAVQAVLDTRLDTQRLTGICGVAGLGNTPYRDGSYPYYIGEAQVDNDPKGVAALMMACAEVLRAG